jgi:hypothetical protein
MRMILSNLRRFEHQKRECGKNEMKKKSVLAALAGRQ